MRYFTYEPLEYTDMIEPQDVSCLILAGGAGTRTGGQDKGLIQWRDKPLIAQVAQAMKKQSGSLLVSCNRNIAQYQALGFRTVTDVTESYRGPLAGIQAARAHIDTRYVVVVACDMPLIPNDLVSRLLRPFNIKGEPRPSITFAHDGNREQYLCAVLHRECLDDVSTYLQSGQGAVKHWYRRHLHAVVDFSDQPGAFRNFNDLESFSPN
ncbi:MAG: molybdenum cofactor guanylyltransferase [Halioglobus sp.]|jgi:molybdenum cofactor guanylyltransferase